MDLKAYIPEVIRILLDSSVPFYIVLLLLVIAVWLSKDKQVPAIKRKLKAVKRKQKTEGGDSMSDGDDDDDDDDDYDDDDDDYDDDDDDDDDGEDDDDDDDVSSDLDEDTRSKLKAFPNPEKQMKKWRNEPIRFAVLGRSNMGKSTFINLVRDVDENDPGYAEEGSGDCTINETEYKHPKNEHITFTDLPGFGTDTITKKTFSQKFDLTVFDFVFIFVDSVIMEDDVWIVKKLQKLKKEFCVIRSKIDLEIVNAKRRGKKENDVVSEIRKKLETKFSKHRLLKGSNLFLISNMKEFFYIGDLPKLFSFIASKLPKRKSDALLFFLPILSPEMIDTKFQILRERIDVIAYRAAVVSAIPVPFLDSAINTVMVKKEIKYYIEVFLLDKSYVREVPGIKIRNTSDMSLENFVNSGLRSMANLGMTILLGQTDCVIPVLGSAIAAKATSVYVRGFLLNALQEQKNDALAVYKHYIKH